MAMVRGQRRATAVPLIHCGYVQCGPICGVLPVCGLLLHHTSGCAATTPAAPLVPGCAGFGSYLSRAQGPVCQRTL